MDARFLLIALMILASSLPTPLRAQEHGVIQNPVWSVPPSAPRLPTEFEAQDYRPEVSLDCVVSPDGALTNCAATFQTRLKPSRTRQFSRLRPPESPIKIGTDRLQGTGGSTLWCDFQSP